MFDTALPCVAPIMLVVACSVAPAPHASLLQAPPLRLERPLGAAERDQIPLPQPAGAAVLPDDAGAPADDRYTTLELANEQDLRIVVRFDPAACAEGDASDLEISVIVAGQVHGELSVATDNAPSVCRAYARQVETDDFNFDGKNDLAIPVDTSGPYGAVTYAVLLQQPPNGHYREAPLLSALTRESMGLFRVDTSKRRLTTSGKSGCCVHYQEDFAVQGDRPQSIGAETITHRFENEHCFVITERSGTRGRGLHKRACRRDEP